MATMQPIPKRSACPERLRLMDAFQAACRDLVTLHNAEIAALIAGHHLERSDLAFNRARQMREDAKKALMNHTQMHNCE